jgi:hypothetical protein
MSNKIVSELLEREPFKTQLLGYTYLTTKNFDQLTKGMNIKYITLNEELKKGGTLLSAEKNGKWDRSYLVMMANGPWKLKFNRNFIFFRPKQLNFRDIMNKIATGEIVINIKKNI